MDINIKVVGIDKIVSNFNILEDKVQKALRKGLNKGADIVIYAARLRVPKQTGRLSGSIDKNISVKKGEISAKLGVSKDKDKGAYYGYFVHEGTIYIRKPQPFLTEPLKEKQEEVINTVGNEIKGVL